MLSEIKPGLPRLMQSILPLLPSGPGGVRKSTFRGPRQILSGSDAFPRPYPQFKAL